MGPRRPAGKKLVAQSMSSRRNSCMLAIVISQLNGRPASCSFGRFNFADEDYCKHNISSSQHSQLVSDLQYQVGQLVSGLLIRNLN